MAVRHSVTSLATAVQTTHPDLILAGIDLGGANGFDVVEALRGVQSERRPAIILVSTHDEEDFGICGRHPDVDETFTSR
jgi:DNA-binding response OmpR family regulator